MRPNTFGRALGIGARLFSQRVLPARTVAQQQAAAEQRLRKARALGRQTRNLGRGSRDLGRSVWNPLAHAGSILWLEITGSFFLLFGVLFAQHLWSLRGSVRSGPEHTRFLIYSVFAVLFLYFALSSFAQVRSRTRKRTRDRNDR